MVKIWDYQNKTCVQTLEGHAQNVTAVCYHPELPIILTGSEDGSLRFFKNFKNIFELLKIKNLACKYLPVGELPQLQYGACLVCDGTEGKVRELILTIT